MPILYFLFLCWFHLRWAFTISIFPELNPFNDIWTRHGWIYVSACKSNMHRRNDRRSHRTIPSLGKSCCSNECRCLQFVDGHCYAHSPNIRHCCHQGSWLQALYGFYCLYRLGLFPSLFYFCSRGLWPDFNGQNVQESQ